MNINLNDHLERSWRVPNRDTLNRAVDVLLACESCFAVVDNGLEIRTTQRGIGFLMSKGVLGVAGVPEVRLKLQLVGARREGHTFLLHVEDLSGETAWVDGATVQMPWLRAACSCKWVDTRHYTLEENAFAAWIDHTENP